MHITEYESIGSFLSKTIEFLEEDEAVNNLMLGICMRLKENVLAYGEKPYLAAVEDEDKLILAAVMTPPRPMTLYGRDWENTGAVEYLVKYLWDKGICLPGVVAEKGLAEKFSNSYKEYSGTAAEIGMNMRVYRLQKVNDVHMPEGYFRPARIEDREIIAEWICGFNEDSGIGSLSLEDGLRAADDKINAGELYIFEDGNPVSMAGTARKTRNGIVIAYVYTPKKYRGKGYATASVASLSKLMLDRGNKFCALFTDLKNPTSNSIYMKIGYEPLCDFDSYYFK